MGQLQISEYATAATNGMVREPALATQIVEFGSESVQSAPFNTATRVIRLYVDSPCAVRFDSDPVATPADLRLHVDVPLFFSVAPDMRLAAISTATGADTATVVGLLELLSNPERAKQWLEDFNRQQSTLEAAVADATAKMKNLKKAQADLARREAQAEVQLAEVISREQRVASREEGLNQQDARLAQREKELATAQGQLNSRFADLESKVRQHIEQSAQREAGIQKLYEVHSQKLKEREAALEARESALVSRETQVAAAHDAARLAEAQHLKAVARMQQALAEESAS